VKFAFFWIWLVAGFLFSTGCHQRESAKHVDVHEHAHHQQEAGITFKEGKGLRITPETANYIGLRVEEVSERTLDSTYTFQAEVYQSSPVPFSSTFPADSATALASALLTEVDVLKLPIGTEITASAAGREFSGRIVHLHSPFGTNAGQIEVVLAVANPTGGLHPGTSLTVKVQAPGDETTLAVPRHAVLRTVEGPFVYAASGERFVRTRIKLGTEDNNFVQVLDGLYSGDQIVTEPVMPLWMAELQSIRGGKSCADE
jgi:hypothetical protein